MTIEELYNAVAYLGFETRLEDEALRRGFYAALGRALTQVNLLRPRHRRVPLYHVRPKNLLPALAPFGHAAGEEIRLSLPGGCVAYTVAVSGTGEMTATDGGGERTFRFSSPAETVLTGEVSGDAALVFKGGAYRVNALGAYYAGVPLGTVIPGRGVIYRMREAVSDFLSFRHPAVYKDGRVWQGEALFEGDTLRLPEDAEEGFYEVDLYLATPTYREEDDGATELPLDSDLVSLLPELIASLIWLDDSPEKAQYYAAVYQRGYARIAAREREGAGVVLCPNGW